MENSISLVYTIVSYFCLFISIQYGTKKSSKKEKDNDEDEDPENLLEMETDWDLEDRAKKAGVGEAHESSDEELEVTDWYYIA
jgi:hypothetical protein